MSSRIVVVEDNDADVMFLQYALDSLGAVYSLHIIDNGEAARTYFTALSAPDPIPDLVILDINLPRCNGIALLSAIRANPSLAALPVFVWSSTRNETDFASTQKLGASDFLIKPTDLEEWNQLALKLCEFLGQPSTAQFPSA